MFFQIRAVRSALAVSRYLASGLKDTLVTAPLCPGKTPFDAPVTVFHVLAVPSRLAVATVWPFGVNAMSTTSCVCPTSSTYDPVLTFQMRAVLFFPPVARYAPRGLKAMLLTKSPLPWSKALSSTPEVAS